MQVDEGLRVQREVAFAAVVCGVDDVDALEDAKMFCDGLAGEAGALREVGDGVVFAGGEADEQRETSFVAQRCESFGARAGGITSSGGHRPRCF